MKGEEDDLEDLQSREVLLPPQVLSNTRSKRRKEVVTVHHDVDESVEAQNHGQLTATSEGEVHRPIHYYQKVVNDVQERDMRKLLGQDEKKSVHEVGDSHEKVPPRNHQNLDLVLVAGVVNSLTEHTVMSSHVSMAHELHEKESVRNHLEQIVRHDGPLELVGLPVLHPPWTGYFNHVEVGKGHRQHKPQV